MRITELAEELGVDPASVLMELCATPRNWFTTGDNYGELGDLYAIKIAPHMVEEARQFLLKRLAREVINHAQDKPEETEDPFFLPEDVDD